MGVPIPQLPPLDLSFNDETTITPTQNVQVDFRQNEKFLNSDNPINLIVIGGLVSAVIITALILYRKR